MTTPAPKVSVLIPTYNHGRFIDEAILSVLAQTYTDFEIVVMDNQSTDSTENIVAKYLSDPRITYHRNEKNLGAIGNFNRCLEHARGEYVKFLLSDDRFHPQLLEKFVNVLDTFPNVALVTSQRETFGVWHEKLSPPLEGLHEGRKVIVESLRRGYNFIGEPSTVMIRRSALPGNFSSTYTCLVDMNLWLRILRNGDCFIIPEVLSYFRLHDGQLTSASLLNNLIDLYTFYKRVETHNEYGVEPAEVGLDKTVRSAAIRCTRAMFSALPRIGRKKNRETILKAFAISRQEQVLLASLAAFLHLPVLMERLQAVISSNTSMV